MYIHTIKKPNPEMASGVAAFLALDDFSVKRLLVRRRLFSGASPQQIVCVARSTPKLAKLYCLLKEPRGGLILTEVGVSSATGAQHASSGSSSALRLGVSWSAGVDDLAALRVDKTSHTGSSTASFRFQRSSLTAASSTSAPSSASARLSEDESSAMTCVFHKQSAKKRKLVFISAEERRYFQYVLSRVRPRLDIQKEKRLFSSAERRSFETRCPDAQKNQATRSTATSSTDASAFTNEKEPTYDAALSASEWALLDTTLKTEDVTSLSLGVLERRVDAQGRTVLDGLCAQEAAEKDEALDDALAVVERELASLELFVEDVVFGSVVRPELIADVRAVERDAKVRRTHVETTKALTALTTELMIDRFDVHAEEFSDAALTDLFGRVIIEVEDDSSASTASNKPYTTELLRLGTLLTQKSRGLSESETSHGVSTPAINVSQALGLRSVQEQLKRVNELVRALSTKIGATVKQRVVYYTCYFADDSSGSEDAALPNHHVFLKGYAPLLALLRSLWFDEFKSVVEVYCRETSEKVVEKKVDAILAAFCVVSNNSSEYQSPIEFSFARPSTVVDLDATKLNPFDEIDVLLRDQENDFDGMFFRASESDAGNRRILDDLNRTAKGTLFDRAIEKARKVAQVYVLNVSPSFSSFSTSSSSSSSSSTVRKRYAEELAEVWDEYFATVLPKRLEAHATSKTTTTTFADALDSFDALLRYVVVWHPHALEAALKIGVSVMESVSRATQSDDARVITALLRVLDRIKAPSSKASRGAPSKKRLAERAKNGLAFHQRRFTRRVLSNAFPVLTKERSAATPDDLRDELRDSSKRLRSARLETQKAFPQDAALEKLAFQAVGELLKMQIKKATASDERLAADDPSASADFVDACVDEVLAT